MQPSLLPTALAASKDVGIPEENIYILEGSSDNGGLSLQGLIERVKTRKIPRTPVRPARKDTLAYLVFSSGTSGLPKGMTTLVDL